MSKITCPTEGNNLGPIEAYEDVRQELERALRKIVDIEATNHRIDEYNQQRQAATDGMAASAGMQRFNQEYIKWYRGRYKSPCEDGGAYAGRWEKHLYAATGNPFAEE